MNLFVLGDPHLSFASQKPMDVFGDNWTDHAGKLAENWKRIVSSDDIVVLAGDTSWAMNFFELQPDFAYLHALPGEKIILKGNHDYWWSTMTKMERFCLQNGFSTIRFLHNNAYRFGDIAVCGTRGWFLDAMTGSDQDQKVFHRELMRLEASLQAGVACGAPKRYVFLHYPPLAAGYVCEPILELLQRYEVKRCYYGHLHGKARTGAMAGHYHGIEFTLISCDNVGFSPVFVDRCGAE